MLLLRSINARNEALCAAAVVVVVGAEAHAERGLFHVDTQEHGERGWDEYDGKTGPCAGVKGECKKDHFQTEVRGMAHDTVETASLESLSCAERDIRAEGSTERKDRRATNPQTGDKCPKGEGRQPAMASRHIDCEVCVHPFVHSEGRDNHDPQHDLRPAIPNLALAPACCSDKGNEDFAYGPKICERVKYGFRIHGFSVLSPACGLLAESNARA